MTKATQTEPASETTPKQLPLEGFVRLKLILEFVPVSAATIWRKVKDGTFPQPIKLSKQVTVWKAKDVREWLESVGGGA